MLTVQCAELATLVESAAVGSWARIGHLQALRYAQLQVERLQKQYAWGKNAIDSSDPSSSTVVL